MKAQLEKEKKKLEEAQVVELKDEKENAINRYMYSREFKDLMVTQDAVIYPDYYKDGWDATIKAFLLAHPDVFEAKDFPCPSVTLPKETYEEEDGIEEEERIINPEESLVKSPMDEDTEMRHDQEGERQKENEKDN